LITPKPTLTESFVIADFIDCALLVKDMAQA